MSIGLSPFDKAVALYTHLQDEIMNRQFLNKPFETTDAYNPLFISDSLCLKGNEEHLKTFTTEHEFKSKVLGQLMRCHKGKEAHVAGGHLILIQGMVISLAKLPDGEVVNLMLGP